MSSKELSNSQENLFYFDVTPDASRAPSPTLPPVHIRPHRTPSRHFPAPIVPGESSANLLDRTESRASIQKQSLDGVDLAQDTVDDPSAHPYHNVPRKHARQAQKIIDHITSTEPAEGKSNGVLSNLLKLAAAQGDGTQPKSPVDNVFIHGPDAELGLARLQSQISQYNQDHHFENDSDDVGMSTSYQQPRPIPERMEMRDLSTSPKLLKRKQSQQQHPNGEGAARRPSTIPESVLSSAFEATGSQSGNAEQQARIRQNIAELLARHALLLRLCQALIQFGAPTHRIEDAMNMCSKAIEVQAACAYSPGLTMLSFVDMATHTSETHLLRHPAGFDLGRLEEVYFLMVRICRQEIAVTTALVQLEEIIKRPEYWGKTVYILSYTLSAALVAPVAFRGSWLDTLVGGTGGLILGLCSLLQPRMTTLSNIFVVFAGIIMGILARGLHHYICFQTVVLSGLVILLPGFQLTLSTMEITARSINSGTTRLISAIMDAFGMGFGASLGYSLFEAIQPNVPLDTSRCSVSVDQRWLILLFPILAVAINIQFGAVPRQFLICIVSNAASFAVAYFTSSIFPTSSLPSAFAAFCVGIICNLYGKIFRKLGFVPILGAVLILVPGSVGVRATLAMLIQQDIIQGIRYAISMITTASGITLGLFTATFLVYPFGKKRVALLTF
ncbi:hypothetical protein BZG36_00189 [Bifiguratus adelaidae]|uniref:Threonine/serine exporter-like N-terminal domain-containing protein n=1 Tax=Bifiguratus adelaidae TaxID=1938954 RepID=A0A261Y885_9FUNG|nr:hypothetical protein BZG36_00189 [Bifiguratus adelaidae]